MEGQGQNEVARYISALHVFIRRLEAANYAPRDSKKQRILLNGLDQDIFQTFISNAERTPYSSYELLVKDLERFAQKPFMIKKLAQLKPGLPQSMMLTKVEQASTSEVLPAQADDRLSKIENILATLTASVAGSGKHTQDKPPCHAFQLGDCKFGDQCRYSHAKVKVFACPHHQSNGHTAAECRAQNPDLARISLTQAKFDATHFMMMTKAGATCGRDRNLWIMDGAATCCATWDPSICFDVTPCHIKVGGSNNSSFFTCTSRGKCFVTAYCPKTSSEKQILISDVLISDVFPSHILSEIVIFAKGCTATKSSKIWEFKKPDGSWLLDASQQVVGSKLYYVNSKAPATEMALVTKADDPTLITVSTASSLKMPVDDVHCARSHHNFRDLTVQCGSCSMPEPAPKLYHETTPAPADIAPDLTTSSQLVPGSTLYYVNTAAPGPAQLLTTTATPSLVASSAFQGALISEALVLSRCELPGARSYFVNTATPAPAQLLSTTTEHADAPVSAKGSLLPGYPSPSDPRVLVHNTGFAATSTHVEDGILAIESSTATYVQQAATVHNTFKDFTHLPTYALAILQRAGMSACGTAPTPAATGVVYTKRNCPTTPDDRAMLDEVGETVVLHHSLVQACNFLCVTTRFDLTFALGKLSKYVANPGTVRWTAHKRLLRYTQGTLDHGFEFVWHGSGPGVLSLSAYCYSSYADDSDTARSTNGAFISTADDAPGGDYDGVHLAFLQSARDAAWLRGTAAALQRTRPALMPPTPVRSDNASTCALWPTPGVGALTQTIVSSASVRGACQDLFYSDVLALATIVAYQSFTHHSYHTH